jgi:hypothetical protein
MHTETENFTCGVTAIVGKQLNGSLVGYRSLSAPGRLHYPPLAQPENAPTNWHHRQSISRGKDSDK